MRIRSYFSLGIARIIAVLRPIGVLFELQRWKGIKAVSSVGQYESPWLDVSSKMVEVLIKAAPGVAGAAVAASGDPLSKAATAVLAPAVTSALNAIVQTQSKQVEQLEQIGGAIEAQMRAPYVGGLNALSDAKRATETKKRQENIKKAISKFEDARDLMQARVLEQGPKYLFQKAAAEYQTGNCYTLLGDLKEAGVCFQSAYSSATDYLLAEGSPVRADWDLYKKFTGVQYSPSGIKEFVQSIDRTDRTEILKLVDPDEKKKLMSEALSVGGQSGIFVGLVALLGGVSMLALGIFAVPVLAVVGAGSVAAIPEAIKYLERKAKEKFTKEAAPALSLLGALRQLQMGAPDLDLKTPRKTLEIQYRRAIEFEFVNPLPTYRQAGQLAQGVQDTARQMAGQE